MSGIVKTGFCKNCGFDFKYLWKGARRRVCSQCQGKSKLFYAKSKRKYQFTGKKADRTVFGKMADGTIVRIKYARGDIMPRKCKNCNKEFPLFISDDRSSSSLNRKYCDRECAYLGTQIKLQSGLESKHITPEMIEMRREMLIFNRLKRELTNGINS